MTTIRPHREVRLAVVMYGGVSLAIYINGVSQELFQLSLATATDESGTGSADNGKPPLKRDGELTGAAVTYRLLARLRSLPRARLEKLEQAEAAIGCTGDPQQRLKDLAAKLPSQIAVKFAIDTLSGTSAGGINAVYLGKALACNADPAPLKDLWIEEADILKLINDRHGRGLLTTPSPPKSLLNGKRMYVKLLEAMARVGGTGDTTKPSGHVTELDVTLTTTDVRGVPVKLKLTEGFTSERRLKDAFTFRYRNYGAEENDFKASNDPLMAFAARCTSAFPFAFEPAQMNALQDVANRLTDPEQKRAASTRDRWPEFMALAASRKARGEAGSPPQACAFADGGYLDNKPFSYAVNAMVARLTDMPVERKLIYIEPSPEVIVDEVQEAPNAIENTVLALSLARYETIREDLERVLTRNRLVDRTRRLLSYVDDDLGAAFAKSPPGTSEFIKGGFSQLLEQFGASYGGYHRLKVGALTDQLASWVANAAGFDPTSDADLAIRALIAEWRNRNFGIDHTDGRRDETSLLFEYDLEFSIRRLRFVLNRLADVCQAVVDGDQRTLTALLQKLRTPVSDPAWPEDTEPLTEALFRLRARLHDALVVLLRARRVLNGKRTAPDRSSSASPEANPLEALFARKEFAAGLSLLLKQLVECESDAARQEHARKALAEADTARMVNEIAAALTGAVASARKEARDKVFSAFSVDDQAAAVTGPLGAWLAALRNLCHRFYDYYHHYDFLSYPLTFSTDVGDELAVVDVIRVSPADACTLVKPGEARRKLAGTELMNFSAFFQENWRRNDLLWGRLDGAERLITALLPPELPTLRTMLVRDAQQRILSEHYSQLKPDLLTKALITGFKAESGAKPNGWITQEEVQQAVTAALAERGSAPKIWDYFADAQGYAADRTKKPQTWAEAISRGSRVTGRILEDISSKAGVGAGASAARWLTRAATGAWGMVIVATPDSTWNLLMRHWVRLLGILSLLLIGIGWALTNHAVQTFGLGLLAATAALGIAWWAMSDFLASRDKAKTMLLWVGVVLAAVGGVTVFLFVRSCLEGSCP